MTRHEQAAKMRAEGKSVKEISAHFGWTLNSTRSMISRGRNPKAFLNNQRVHSNNYYARTKGKHGRSTAGCGK